ncbi:MAG TPA: M48 family metallopeptidase [Thermoanaerobaculia bacterium]|nr:M48 family metallopeptidase [Thermoanaerobaculia bacterium]
MDFFQRQEDARRATRRLVALFVLAVAGVVVAVNVAAATILLGSAATAVEAKDLFRRDVVTTVSLVTLAIIVVGSLYKIVTLAAGGPAVAQLLGGKPLDPDQTDPAERRLLNVVEEMALASGTSVPTVYVLDHEDGINAFAAGFTPDDAVIGVTRGALETLDREELQGVIGHEFSHLLNGDMRLNLRLIGLLHGILVIGQIGYWILRSAGRGSSSSGRKRGAGGGVLLFGVAILVIGYVGVFFGKLIKSAVSRQREFLADAASAQFTRNPFGLAGALRKIGGLAAGSRLSSPNAEQASHLFFGNGVGDALFAWTATHPPLAERIRRLDPSFDGAFPKVERPARRTAARARAAGLSPSAARAAEAAESARTLAAEAAVATIGSLTAAHLAYAEALRDRLPPALADRARHPASARALVCALLLAREPEVRASQLVELAAHSADPPLLGEVRAVMFAVESCAAEARLPLLDLAVPALRRMSPPQWRAFRDLVTRLVEADERLDVFELALRRVLIRHVEPAFEGSQRSATRYYSLERRGHECSVLLSALAWRGGNAHGVDPAFARGAAHLPGVAATLLAEDECGPREVEAALRELDGAAPRRKQELLVACAVTIAHDRFVTIEEGELLRALADALQCPMPPLLPGESLMTGEIG